MVEVIVIHSKVRMVAFGTPPRRAAVLPRKIEVMHYVTYQAKMRNHSVLLFMKEVTFLERLEEEDKKKTNLLSVVFTQVVEKACSSPRVYDYSTTSVVVAAFIYSVSMDVWSA